MDIVEFFAYTAPDQQGNEAVIGFAHPKEPNIMVPLVSANRMQMEQFRPFAQKLAGDMKMPVKLIRFTGREEVETIS